MPAASTDKFTLVGNPGSATTLAAPGHTIAGTVFNVTSTSNWPTTTGVVFAVDNYTLQTVNGVPNTAVRTPGTYTEWQGVVASGTQITGAVLRYGTDQNYTAGSLTRVYIPVASQWVAQLVGGLLVEHNQDGTHGAVTATSLAVTGALTLKSYDGWITGSNTWVYTSGATTNVGTVTIAGTDLTSRIQVGDRVSITQTTVKYAIVTKIVFSTDTVITLFFGTDYTIANAAITAPRYSHDKAPVGFPVDPAKWTVSFTDTSDRTQATPTQNVWYNVGTSTVTIPIGAWDVFYEVTGQMVRTASASLQVKTTLSTANNSESDKDLTAISSLSTTSGQHTTYLTNQYRRKTLVLASSTPYYLNIVNIFSSATSLDYLGSSGGTTMIRAICAYL